VKRPLSNATISAIWASVRLRVPERRVLGLAREAHLAAVPHDRAEEAEIGGRQWAPVDRHEAGRLAGEAGHRVRGATVWVTDRRHLEFERIGHGQADADQALADQQRVGLPFGGERRHIRARTGGAVHQAEDRIPAAALRKARRDAGRTHGPARLRLMAAETGSPIAAEILEERVVGRKGRPIGLEGRHRAAHIAIELEAWNDRRCRLCALISVLEPAHRLHVPDHAGRECRDVAVTRKRRSRHAARDASQRERDGRCIAHAGDGRTIPDA